ncbi:hypothetical protein ABZP36_001358 [Zizania latifolia]
MALLRRLFAHHGTVAAKNSVILLQQKGYASSKTLTEKELLRYNERERRPAFEVVTLACALVGGDTDTTQLHVLEE